MLQDPQTLSRFYGFLDAEAPRPRRSTSFAIWEFFEQLLQREDVAAHRVRTGMTQSTVNARTHRRAASRAVSRAEALVVDSLCSSSLRNAGRLCRRHARRGPHRADAAVAGKPQNIHHQFTHGACALPPQRTHVRPHRQRSPRSLGICPISVWTRAAHIAHGKGARKGGRRQNDRRYGWSVSRRTAEYAGKCFICHSRCPEDAEKTRAAVEARFPNLRGKIRICEIGTIIASHCGPGTVAVFFLGAERAPE